MGVLELKNYWIDLISQIWALIFLYKWCWEETINILSHSFNSVTHIMRIFFFPLGKILCSFIFYLISCCKWTSNWIQNQALKLRNWSKMEFFEKEQKLIDIFTDYFFDSLARNSFACVMLRNISFWLYQARNFGPCNHWPQLLATFFFFLCTFPKKKLI